MLTKQQIEKTLGAKYTEGPVEEDRDYWEKYFYFAWYDLDETDGVNQLVECCSTVSVEVWEEKGYDIINMVRVRVDDFNDLLERLVDNEQYLMGFAWGCFKGYNNIELEIYAVTELYVYLKPVKGAVIKHCLLYNQ